MNLIFFDNWCRPHLLPLTYTRPASELRVGILTIREKWERLLGQNSSTLSQIYLQEKFPLLTADDNLLIASSLLPNDELIAAILGLKIGEALYDENHLLAFRTDDAENLRNFYDSYLQIESSSLPYHQKSFNGNYQLISRPFHIFLYNEQEITRDFELITHGRTSQPLSPTNVVIGDANRIFLEEGAVVEDATLNVREGYIYIGKDAEVMEGCRLRGPIALCEHAVTKLDTKIYGATTIGPYSKVGGELSNVVILGYSNKAHDGFLGNSVIGEWCNLGAATNCSNLKNNYSNVRLWDYFTHRMEETNQQFCGLIMGDHSKCGINSMFNTGTTVGVCTCLFGTNLHPKFVPSFSFGNASHAYERYILDQAMITADMMMQRRHKSLDAIEQNLLKKVYEIALRLEK